MVGNFYALGEGSESDSFLSGSSTGLEACYRSINVCHKPIRESNYVVWKRSILSCLIERSQRLDFLIILVLRIPTGGPFLGLIHYHLNQRELTE